MTEEDIRALIASEVEKQLIASNVGQADYEVLETIMFEHPADWGRRIILRDNEIILQRTGNKGVTWKDENLGDYKLMLPATSQMKSLRTSGNNPYQGLQFVPTVLTKSLSNESEELKISPEIQSCIDSGKLLSKGLVEKNTDTQQYSSGNPETITFLGGATFTGLSSNQVYLDENRFLKLS